MGLFGMGGAQTVLSWKVSIDDASINKMTQSMKGMNAETGKGPGLFKSASAALNGFVMVGFAVQQVVGIFRTLGNAVQDFLKSAEDAEHQQAALVAVLKSTHGVAGVTLKDINDMAEAMTRYTAYDDDAIRASSAMLLTFTSVGHTVFKRAQADILDVASAFHEDLQTATVQVGKALQSAQGWTALKRIGVNISEQMLQTAKQLYDTGHAAEAQNIILKELETEFGGQAAAAGKTFAGVMTILGNRIDDVKKAIGLALMPILTELANSVIPFVEKKIEDAQAATKGWGDVWEKQLKPPLKSAMLILGDVKDYVGQLAIAWDQEMAPAVKEVTDALGLFTEGAHGASVDGIRHGLLDAFMSMVPAVRDVAKHLASFIHDILPQLKEAFGDIKLKDILAGLGQLAGFIAHNIGPAFKVWAALAAAAYVPLGLLIGVIGFLVAKLKELWQRWPPLQNAVHGAADALGKFGAEIGKRLGPALKNLGIFFQAVMKVIGPMWNAFWPQLQMVLAGVWLAITGIIQVAWSLISGIIKMGLDILGGNFAQFNLDAADAFGGIVDGAKKILGGLIAVIWGILGGMVAVIAPMLGKAKDALFDGFHAALDAIGGQLHEWQDFGGKIIGAIVAGIQAAGNAVGNAVHNVVANIPGVQGHVPGFASGGISRGGIAMVGERGPELVMLPTGARVYNNQDTRQIAAPQAPPMQRQQTFNIYGAQDGPAFAKRVATQSNRLARLANPRLIGA